MRTETALATGLAAGLMAAMSAALIAGPVTLPYTFTAGTPAKASEVNANFSAVKTAVDDNDARIGAVQTTVTPAGNIVLVPSTATSGNILKGTTPFVHNFGDENTFLGENAGNLTMNGGGNTASGFNALRNNTFGNFNTAAGRIALFFNTTGSFNTASGVGALWSNTTGNSNTASGTGALQNNTSGANNTASGVSALLSNTTGGGNTASGASALLSNTTGVSNTASGAGALVTNTLGVSNTATGADALKNNTVGNGNIAIGANAGGNLTTGSNNIDIGNRGVAAESNTIRLGNPAANVFGDAIHTATFVAGIRGATTGLGDAIPVVIDSAGQLGTVSSSRRVKDDIADMGEASGALMKLRPVTFHYKSDKNPAGRTLQYGLVAEEVAKVAPGLVARSADGKIETVYYQFLAPMLLNEVQKQQRTIGAQTVELTQQKLEIAELRQQAARIAVLEREAARMAALLARLEPADKVASTGR